jgi:trypsin
VNSPHPGWVKTDMSGSSAPMKVNDGAKTVVQLATIDGNGPTGAFFRLGQRLPGRVFSRFRADRQNAARLSSFESKWTEIFPHATFRCCAHSCSIEFTTYMGLHRPVHASRGGTDNVHFSTSPPGHSRSNLSAFDGGVLFAVARRMTPRKLLAVLFVVYSCGPAVEDAPFDDEQSEVVESEIVGGVSTSIRSVPWQVAVMNRNFRQYCGGSIIAPSWIVTATHCDVSIGDKIGAGDSRLDKIRAERQIRTVAQVVAVPGFDLSRLTAGKDLMLVRLDTPLQIDNQRTRAIAYASESDARQFAAGVTATISGWGATSTRGGSPSKLRRTTVRIASASQVDSNFGSGVSRNQIGTLAEGKGICFGDSGGPLVVLRGDGTAVLAGVSSYVRECAHPSVPSMFTRVASFSAFIQKTTGVAP